MKTIPEAYQLKVSVWGDSKRWTCRVERGDVAFAASDLEVAELSRVSWSYCFTDISRTVRAYPWSLTIFENADGRPYADRLSVVTDEVNYHTYNIDVRHLFKVVQGLRDRARVTDPDNIRAEVTLDVRRFQTKPMEVEQANLIQLIRRFTSFERCDWNRDPVPRWRDWSRSLKSFAAMAPDKWVELRHWLCQRNSSPGHRVWPCGDGELGFNLAGINGAVICRGDDWSSHT